MKRACIAIVDALRARIYTYERTTDEAVGGTPAGALHETIDLVNPGGRGHDQFSTTKPGIKRTAPGGGTTDDHRDAHADELARRFARQVIGEIDRVVREHAFNRVLLVASPAMLGELRSAGDALHRAELEVDYVARDLARLTSPQIHDHLAQLRLVAPPRRQTFVAS